MTTGPWLATAGLEPKNDERHAESSVVASMCLLERGRIRVSGGRSLVQGAGSVGSGGGPAGNISVTAVTVTSCGGTDSPAIDEGAPSLTVSAERPTHLVSDVFDASWESAG